MPEPSETDQGGEPVETLDSSTMRTSQAVQVRGYLESLTEMDYIDELQNALENARRLTKSDWTIVITDDQITIKGDRETKDDQQVQDVQKGQDDQREQQVQGTKKASGSQKRIKIPKPKSLDP